MTSLLREHPEHFYYVTLTTPGEAMFVTFSAWSTEALERAGSGAHQIKWSYADSPYCAWRSECFEPVAELLARRPSIYELDDDEAEAEFELRIGAMELALRRLDEEGLFGRGAARLRIVVAAEVMPPDFTNTPRVRRLNPPEALTAWLVEAAEPELE